MEKEKLNKILMDKIDELMKLSYEELLKLVEKCEKEEPEHLSFGDSGSEDFYQMEIDVFFENKKSKDIRVSVAVDDGGWSAFFPLGYGFTMKPDGTIP